MPLVYYLFLLRITVGVPLSARLRLTSALFFSSFNAPCSLCDRLYFGFILTPLPFNLYLNELLYIVNNNAKDPILLPDGSYLNCLLYADDLLLISNSVEGFQQSLDRLSKYC